MIKNMFLEYNSFLVAVLSGSLLMTNLLIQECLKKVKQQELSHKS